MSDAKRKAIGVAVAGALIIVLAVAVFSTQWDDYMEYDTPQGLPTFPDSNVNPDDASYADGELREDSLSYSVFEKYGIILIPLALLMFGAMVGGVVISREEAEIDDSN